MKSIKERRSKSSPKSSAVLEHQIEKKLIKTVGSSRNGIPLTTASTTSSSKISLTSNSVGKSVISSLSMSLERKDSIRYMPRKIAPTSIPAGQSTVIHLDNYTHFMAQRVITTKAAFKRAEIFSEDHNSNVHPESMKKASGIVDADLGAVGGVDSSYRNKKALNMHKHKLHDVTPTTPSEMAGHKKSSLALECTKPKVKTNIKKDIAGTTAPIKAVVKKPNKSGRKKNSKPPRQPKQSKVKTENSEMQEKVKKEADKDELEKMISPLVMAKGEHKLLRPCIYTLQSKKCLNEITCPYLHSEFPCKYYYLNISCPQDFKCQFMHNGPLEPKLKEALRNHILELLSMNPSAVETHFVQQIHCIDDLSHRLQYFQVVQNQKTDIIEVMDDADEDHVLVVDESSNDVSANNNTETTNTNLSNISYETDELNSQYSIDRLDTIYEKFKETNYAVDEIDKKLKCLKTASNISPNEKINQLQIIYDLLKEQEKRLEIYENATSTTQKNVCDNEKHSENAIVEKPNIVLLSPNIVNDIVTLESQETPVNAQDEENSMAAYEGVQMCVRGNEFLANEEENFVISSDEENNVFTAENQQIPPINAVAPMPNRADNKEESVVDTNNEQITSSTVPEESDIEFINIQDDGMNNSSQDDKDHNLNRPCHGDCEKTITLTNVKQFFNNFGLTANYEITDHNNDDFEMNRNESAEEQIVNENISQNALKNNSEIDDDKNVRIFDTNKITQLSDEDVFPIEETLVVPTTKDEQNFENNTKEISCQIIGDQSHSFEKILPYKPEKTCRVRLRSHRLQDNEEINEIASESSLPALEHTKPIRTRRLKLPKPSKKPAEKSLINECKIDADVINKLIKSSKTASKATREPVLDAKIPITQNAKRFLTKSKDRRNSQQSQLMETSNDINLNADKNLSALHSCENKNLNGIENIDGSLPSTQTSEDSYSSNTLQDLFIANVPSSSESYGNVAKTNFTENMKLQEEIETNNKQHIPIKHPLTTTLPNTPPDSIKEKYNLGNPQVLLAKLKIPFLLQTKQKHNVQSSITTSPHVNPIVTSSLLADKKLAQKRRCSGDGIDSVSSLKERKCLKSNNAQSIKIIDNFELQSHQESRYEKDVDFETDSGDEELTTTSSYNSHQQQEGIQTSSTHQVKHHHQRIHREDEHGEEEEQTENESDLRQQIENVSNKSDLQLQMQQQHKQKRMRQHEKKDEIFSKTTTDTSFITKNSNNLSHEQYKKEENNVMVLEAVKEDAKGLFNHKHYEEDKSKESEIVYDNIEKDKDDVGRAQSVVFKCIFESEKLTSNSSNEISAVEEEINSKYSNYSTLFKKLTNNSTKRQITFEKSSVNITPISSPTYGNDDTIASPSPTRKLIDSCMGGEIDGRLTYPPVPYILYEIDLGKIEINKPLHIDKLKRTIQLDPRVFRTHIKKQSTIVNKTIQSAFNALIPMPSTSNNVNVARDSSKLMQSISSMVIPYDPRNRSSVTMADISTSSLSQQTALTPYNSLQTAVAPLSSSSASFMQTGIPDAVPLALQYHGTSQTIIQPQPQPQQQQQQQQTPNMFLYGCLQRSLWYQNLMSTMKIQINQSISQLVRALNNFHRERVFNPEIVFDLFKIDCAGELLEIMRNLGIFVDANGIINEQRHMPSFAGHACCNNVPVNATYSFIQQYLTPNTHCTSMATASSTNGINPHGQLNINEPFVSCYVKAPEPPQKHSHNCCSTAHYLHNDNNSCNRSCTNRNDNNRNDYNNRCDNNNTYNSNYSGKRYNNQFKKPYDNNDSTSNSYQQRSNHQRSSYNNYNNNPRFMKPGAFSPSKSSLSPSSSPKRAGAGAGGGGGGGGVGGGRFNNSKRFNNYNKDNNNDWYSSGSNDNRYNNKYQNSGSPPRSSSPNLGSPRAVEPKSSLPSAPKSDEESWD